MATRFTRDQAHAYWRSPDDGKNLPHMYLDYEASPVLHERDQTLTELFERHVSKSESVLEVGPNAGRNLAALLRAGYRDLTAIEISPAAIDAMRELAPDVHSATTIVVGPVEDAIAAFPAKRFGTILCVAVLVHIPRESESVFEDIAARAANRLILIEHEQPHESPRHFPRNYRPVFERCGFNQIWEEHPVHGFPKAYVARVFERAADA